MDEFRLTAKQITTLHALHRKQRDRRFADRIKAIVLLGTGLSVAEALLIDETPACCLSTHKQVAQAGSKKFATARKISARQRNGTSRHS